MIGLWIGRGVGFVFLALALAFIGTLAGCAGGPGRVMHRSAPPISYADVAEAHNARAARLDRVWARAVVELWYVDDRGKIHREQGEGHLQVRQPNDVALSIGKLGETYAWLGADGERFWFFDKFEKPRVVVGRFKNIGRPCAEALGLPADPRTLLDIMGMTPIPATGGSTAWSEDGRRIVVSFARGGAVERLYLDAKTLLPARIELVDATGSEGAVTLVATLGKYEPVVQSDEGGFYPRLASRVEIRHDESHTRIALHLADMEDGGSRAGRLRDAAFDFDSLRAVFRPVTIRDLDRACDEPALGG